MITVLNEPLGKDPSGIAIKFSLTIEHHGGTGDDERHANDVSRTNEMIASQVVGTSFGTVNPTTDVLTEVLAVEKIWGDLLQNVEHFNEIAVGVPEVSQSTHRIPPCLNAVQIHPYTSLASSVLAATNKVRSFVHSFVNAIIDCNECGPSRCL